MGKRGIKLEKLHFNNGLISFPISIPLLLLPQLLYTLFRLFPIPPTIPPPLKKPLFIGKLYNLYKFFLRNQEFLILISSFPPSWPLFLLGLFIRL